MCIHFLFFFIPPFPPSSFQWSKLPNLQMYRKLVFIWKTYAQPAIGVVGIPRVPRGCAQRKALESQPKGRIKEQNAEKISWFFLYSYSLRKKKERDRVFKEVWGDAKKSDFLSVVIFQWKVRERGHFFSQKWYKHGILSYFFDSEQLFGEWATLKVSTFLAYFHYC